MTPEQTLRLRAAQLELLAELDRVCRAHRLNYFAMYGTLLGAVRHQGFIPWDDDLDVGLLRSDFDRLPAAMESSLGERFFFQTVDSDPAFGCMFAKLRLNGTRCVDVDGEGSAQHNGIFIDIFPVDAKAPGGLAQREQRAMRYVGFRLLMLKARYQFMGGTSVPSRIIQWVARTGIHVLPRRAIIALNRRNTRLGRGQSQLEPAEHGAPAQYVSLFGAYPYDRDNIDADWINPLVSLPFEDTTIPAFANHDGYLTRLYGDYMQPPPVADQIGHHFLVELDFGS